MNATYETIDQSMQSVDWNSFNANTLVPQTLREHAEKIAKMYGALRPLFVAASTFPLIPADWRTGVQVFTTALDALAAEISATPDFKAGKDL